MEESRLVALGEARQKSGSLSGMSDARDIAAAGRQLEELSSRTSMAENAHEGATERLLFWIGGKPYSAALTSLREALPAIPIATPLPFSPSWLVGLFQLRTDLVTLIDPRPLLGNDGDAAPANGQIAPLEGEQALLLGETGRLIAFVVDRLGDIVSVSSEFAPLSDEEIARLGIARRYLAEERLRDGEGHEVAVALNLTTLYEDVISKLEVWSRNA